MGPLLGVFVNRGEEQVVEKPDMGGKIGIKTRVCLQIQEKRLPLLPKPMRDIVPEAFDPCIMYASTGDMLEMYVHHKHSTYLPQMYDPRPSPFNSSMRLATRTFSVP